MKKTITTILSLVVAGNSIYAQNPIFAGDTLNINNVSAMIGNQCSEFWNPNQQASHYEVPKGSGLQTLFAGNMWMGGYDISNQLHLSAATYSNVGNNGTNFWPGPLDISNATAADANQWNLIWKVSRSEILYHIANWNSPGYTIPASILNWPGNAPAGSNYNPVLAPFFDSNANQLYEPQIGEFPFIYGDQAIYFICNDNYLPNAFTNPNLKIEIHGMAYAFSDPSTPAIDNTVFFRYQIVNRSGITYNDVRFGLWTDADMGSNASNDYFGTDVGRSMYYFYNSGTSSSLNEPSQGIKFLSHALTSSIRYENVNGVPTGNPATQDDYYQYIDGTWLDGLPVTFDGDGRNQANTATPFMYSGNTDTAFPGQFWSMPSAAMPPSDMLGIGGVTIGSYAPNQVITIDVAYITAYADSGGPDSSIAILQNYTDTIMARYASGAITSVEEHAFAESAISMELYPNPVTDYAFLNFTSDKTEKGRVVITDIEGRTVGVYPVSTKEQLRIDRKNYDSGIYIVTAEFPDHRTLTMKMMIN